jgi:hypothetical protein
MKGIDAAQLLDPFFQGRDFWDTAPFSSGNLANEASLQDIHAFCHEKCCPPKGQCSQPLPSVNCFLQCFFSQGSFYLLNHVSQHLHIVSAAFS